MKPTKKTLSPGISLTVEFCNNVFLFLGQLSIFTQIRRNVDGRTVYWWGRFVDIWVLGHFFLSILSTCIVRITSNKTIRYLFMVYGLIRVFEIVVSQINILLFDEYRNLKVGKPYVVRSYRRMIINLFTNFAEIIFWFATSYAVFLTVPKEMSFMRLVFNSFSIMTTFGYSTFPTEIADSELWILWFQSSAGLLMTLLSVARFLGLLPQVKSMDEFSKSDAVKDPY